MNRGVWGILRTREAAQTRGTHCDDDPEVASVICEEQQQHGGPATNMEAVP